MESPPVHHGYPSYHGRHMGGGSGKRGHGNHRGNNNFAIYRKHVSGGTDQRSTVMIRNIPNKYTQQMLLQEIDESFRGLYDFFYLPIDFKNRCNVGYAFVNFIDCRSILNFLDNFDGNRWKRFNSEKVCAVSYARIQGKNYCNSCSLN